MERKLRTVVSGAASGIGLAVAEALRARGDQVIGVDYQPAGTWIQADLASPAERKRVVDSALKEFGQIDVLVNVAGIFRPTPIENSSPDDWQSVWSVNLEAPIHLMSLVTYRNRLQTLYNWTVAYFSKDQPLRMIIRPGKNDDTSS